MRIFVHAYTYAKMGRFIERQDVTVLLVVLLLSGLLMRQAKCQVGLTNEGKQQILDELNRLRGLVNPTAANMRRLVLAIAR